MANTVGRTTVEILTFAGCTNRSAAIALVSDVLARTGIDADVRVVDVPDVETARRTRFLGSPTIRVDGRDVEPGADERTDHVYACRVYGTGADLAGVPSEKWLVDALVTARARSKS